MEVKNSTQYEISTRWNRYMGTVMVDVSENNGTVLKCCHPLRKGDQSIGHGIRASVSMVSPQRYYGDILDATVEFYSGC